MTLTLTLTDLVTPYFIQPLVYKLAIGGRSVVGFVGGYWDVLYTLIFCA